MRLFLALFFIAASCITALAQTRSSVPDFTAPDMQGQIVDTAKLRGKVVVFNLWFINCPNCLDEIKQLDQVVADYRNNKDVVFIGLAASKRADLVKFLAKDPFDYRIVPDAGVLILSKFGTPDKNGEINVPFPMHYVLDRNGNVVLQQQGVKGVAAVRAELKRQLGG